MRNEYENASNLQVYCVFLKNRYGITDEALEGIDYAEEFLQETEDIYFKIGDTFLEEWDEKKNRYEMRFNLN